MTGERRGPCGVLKYLARKIANRGAKGAKF